MIIIKLETSLTNMIRHQHQVDVEVYYKKTGEHIQTLSDDGEAAFHEYLIDTLEFQQKELHYGISLAFCLLFPLKN